MWKIAGREGHPEKGGISGNLGQGWEIKVFLVPGGGSWLEGHKPKCEGKDPRNRENWDQKTHGDEYNPRYFWELLNKLTVILDCWRNRER